MPVWQAQFGLSYAALAVIRALYYATMGGLQLPANRLLSGWSPRAALILSTAIAAAGLGIMALPLGLAGLCVGLFLAGLGRTEERRLGKEVVSTRRSRGWQNH